MKSATYLIRRSCCVIALLLMNFLAINAQQVARGLTASSNGVFIGFYEYTPTDYASNPSTKYPLIIFLHGIGERGNGTSELPNVLGQGIPKYISQGNTMTFYWNGKWETFLVLSPQLSRNYGDWQNFYVDEMLNYAKTNLRVDTNRIFLTGLSLGGGGVWRYASTSLANARKFAAIAPVCGTCSMVNACNIAQANLPVWAFHANDDGVVGVGCTTSSIQSINNCNPAVRPLMTLYNDGNHFIWDRAYDMTYYWQDPHLFEWMLGQSRAYPVTNTPPTANAGADIVITHPVTSTVLNASASTDPDGTIARYTWKKLTGPTGGIIQNPAAAVTNLTGLMSVGVYTFEVMVVDNRAVARRDTVQVTVNQGPPGTNLPPVAVAGPDQTITVDNAIITAWGSFDVDGGIVAYLWTKVSGPAQYNMPYNMYNSAGITGMVSGVYKFELQVTDNSGNIGKDTVQITVNLSGPPPPNQPPVANAGTDISLTLPANSTTLNGNGSTDNDGTISSYLWAKISGPTSFTIGNVNASSTSLTNLVQGTYSFRITVTDNSGASASDTVVVTVNQAAPPPVNQVPNANAGVDITLTLPQNNTTLTGVSSNDPDGTITNYFWTKISGPAQYSIGNSAAATTSLTGLAQGTYLFALEVTDNAGATDADTVQVTVNAAPSSNLSPIAKAGADISLTLPTNSTTLTGYDSYDPDGTIASYAWAKVSGPAQFSLASPGSGQTSLTNLVQGTYSFSLTIVDNLGANSTDTVQVIVGNAPPPPNQVPVANAGADIAITLPTNSTTLNGTLSADPDGTIVSYNWVKISGPTQFSFGNANAATTSLGNLVQGTYSFRLIVTDNSGAVDSDTMTVTVNAAPPPPNQLPNAIAGSNIVLTLPINNSTLDGTSSNDPDGSIVSYTWSKISGPATYTLANPSGASTALSNLIEGTYQFRLLVTDNNGGTDADTVTVLVNPAPPPPPPANIAPNANAGNDVTITLPTNSVNLDGNGSTDPDGTLVSFLWTKLSGPNQFSINSPTSINTSVVNLIAGVYSFRLQVTDNNGATDVDTIVVTVNAAPPPPPPSNQVPNANAGADQTITLPISTVSVSGSSSNDPDGTIASYSWTWIGGPAQYSIANPSSVSTNITNLVAGTYSFRLLVTDNGGATDADTILITVNPAALPVNRPPVANAGVDFNTVVPGPTVRLNGTASTDPDGTITAYSWVKVSGPGAITIVNSTTATPSLSGLQVGQYVFELTVTDNDGATAKDEVTVVVTAAPNQLPVANAGIDTAIAIPASTAVLNGRASFDPDGVILAYSWRQISGPNNASLLNNSISVTAITGLVTGDYVFELTVTDNKGDSNKDSVTVSVIDNQKYEEVLMTYPNPSTGAINIRCVSDSIGQGRITIYDMSGHIVRNMVIDKGRMFYEVHTDISGLKAGVYVIEFTIGKQKRMITRFIKQ